MNKFILISSLVLALGACQRKTNDPTYHDPAVTAGAKNEQQALAMRNRSNSNRYDLESIESCVTGCERYSKINADVDAIQAAPKELRQGASPSDYAPVYEFKINPNVPAAE